MESVRTKDRIVRVVIHVILIIMSIIMIVPFFWMILTAFKTVAESTSIDPFVIFPADWKFENFSIVWKNHYYEKAVVLMDSGTMDAIVMEPENLALLGEHGRLIDLNDGRTKALVEQYSDRLITVSHTDEDGIEREIPVGIDISDSALVKQGAYKSCAIGICADAQHIEAIETFLTYILQKG